MIMCHEMQRTMTVINSEQESFNVSSRYIKIITVGVGGYFIYTALNCLGLSHQMQKCIWFSASIMLDIHALQSSDSAHYIGMSKSQY